MNLFNAIFWVCATTSCLDAHDDNGADDTDLAPSLSAKKHELEKALLEDALTKKLAERPAPEALVQKHILEKGTEKQRLQGEIISSLDEIPEPVEKKSG